jgi:hemerythrin-like metal-binding protein
MNSTSQANPVGRVELDFEPMDDMHREFHELVDALAQAGDEGDKLFALHEHLLRHCAQEEQWMSDYPPADCAGHRREHAMLLEVVSEVRRRFDAGDTEIVQRLAQELPPWFAAHVEGMDRKLADCLRQGPPPALRSARRVAPLAAA